MQPKPSKADPDTYEPARFKRIMIPMVRRIYPDLMSGGHTVWPEHLKVRETVGNQVTIEEITKKDCISESPGPI